MVGGFVKLAGVAVLLTGSCALFGIDVLDLNVGVVDKGGTGKTMKVVKQIFDERKNEFTFTVDTPFKLSDVVEVKVYRADLLNGEWVYIEDRSSFLVSFTSRNVKLLWLCGDPKNPSRFYRVSFINKKTQRPFYERRVAMDSAL